MTVDLTSVQLQRLIEVMKKDSKDATDKNLISYLEFMKQKAVVQEKAYIQRSIELDEIPF